ncbi:MAG: hypothetical protein HY319_09880 [Armatimonadetes bacterium]|nr:hypothetical protein [Armatimonadota bacterium]
MGAVWVQDNYTQSARVVDGRELFTGDIYLDDGVRLTLNEDYIQTGGGVYGASALPGPSGRTRGLWHGESAPRLWDQPFESAPWGA